VSYTVLNVGTVDVVMTVTDPGGLSATDSLQIFVVERPADTGWLEGFVLDSDSGPIAGAKVDVDVSWKLTDSSGHYNITLTAGEYSADATADGYSSDSGEATVEVDKTSWLNFTLMPTTGSLTGHISDVVTGAPMASATVALTGETMNVSIMTNTEGYYEILQMTPGTYTLKVNYPNYVENETSVVIVAGETIVVDMTLTPESSDDSSGSGSNSLIIAGAVIAAAVVAGVAAMMLLKRKKEPAPPPPTQ
jgi:5-hydroxyisourate hydrolase-like protein (transthyretin family)